MRTTPEFSVTRNGEAVATFALENDATVRHQTDFGVNEQQFYGFEVASRELDVEYGLWIGDIEAGRAVGSDGRQATTVGIPRGRFVLWDDAAYFEGARGIVWIRARSRTVDSELWRDRALVCVVVSSSKLSEARYKAMLDQMASLASGLVLDLVSKATRSLRMSPAFSRPEVHSSAVELRLLESAWPKIARCLQQIAHEPAVQLHRVSTLCQCWGSERLDSRSLLSMAKQGVRPATGAVQVPFKTQIARICEDSNTREHRLILGFIRLLQSRTSDVKRDLNRHIESIEADRVWRDRSPSGQPSLYIQEDVPRLERLRGRLARTIELLGQLRRATEMPLFRNIRPEISFEVTPVFAGIEPYRRIRYEMLRFLRSGMVVLDHGIEERVKSTSRLYEQWVFLQIVAAMKVVGLECFSQQGVLLSTRQLRFTLDIDRGARVTFRDCTGRSVVVRYEPWIMPQIQAAQNYDTVYRGIEGASAWSPDVLIEFLGNESPGRAATVEYAAVIDAKYTRVIRDHHWNDTQKYLEIRATATGKQIARQQWLAYSGKGSPDERPILVKDSSIKWTRYGPDCSFDDRFVGAIQITPPLRLQSEATENGWIAHPEKSIVEFVQGLLSFMQLTTAAE